MNMTNNEDNLTQMISNALMYLWTFIVTAGRAIKDPTDSTNYDKISKLTTITVRAFVNIALTMKGMK